MKTKLHHFFILLTLFAGIHQAAAQGTTAFTYQGQLHDNGTNANGAYTMTFKLYDAVTGGNPLGTNTSNPTLANGLFSVNLDFGAGAFPGSARWLDITITIGATTQTLSPRVALLPVPYAQFAAVAATVTNGAIMNAQLAVNAVADTNIVAVNGAKVSGTVANAASLTNGIWNVTVGNYQTPNGGPLLANTLIFSAQGVGQAILSSGSTLFGVIGDVTCNTNRVNTIRFNGNGSTITSDGLGGLLFNVGGNTTINRDLIVNASIQASGEIIAQSFGTTSDRSLKEKFTPIDNQAILERVASLPITSWNFKTEGNTRHIGPMAQDFYAAFNVGTDDRHIATVDEDGVALAAIQGLNEKLKDRDAEIQVLKQSMAELKKLVQSMAETK